MKQDVSRRNFVALAGAGLAVAACTQIDEGPAKSNSVDDQAKNWGNDVKSLISRYPGIKMSFDPDLNHGRLPTLTPTTTLDANGNPINGLPYSKQPFKPDHIAIVAIHWSENGIRSSEHWFKNVLKTNGAAANNEQKFVSDQIKIIRKKIPNNSSGDVRRKSFKEFRFGSQHKIYFYIVNEGYKFFSPLPISFSKRSGDEFGPDQLGESRDENHSFFEAKVLENWVDGSPDTVGGPRYNTSVVQVSNWFMDEKGTSLTRESKKMYGLHINTLHPNGEPGGFKAVGLDPDTGNGWGWTP